MAGFVTDNEFEKELTRMTAFLETLKQGQTIYISTHAQLPLKEKVKLIQKIQADQKRVVQFIEKSKQEDLFNSGIKFKLENLKNRFSLLLAQWRKIETSEG